MFFTNVLQLAKSFELAMYSCKIEGNNQKLTPMKCKLMRRQAHLGHSGMQMVTWLAWRNLLGPFSMEICSVQADDFPACAICTYTGQTWQPTGSTWMTMRPETDGSICHGEFIALNQFEMSKSACKFGTGGSEKELEKFCGGMIFVDVSLGYMKVYFPISSPWALTKLSKPS